MMPVFLLNFFRGFTLKRALYVAGATLVAVAIYIGASFVNDKFEAEAEVARLEQRVATQEEAIRILNQVAEQKNSAIEAADAARAELEALRETYDEIIRDADTVKDEDDGEVAPVLRRTLDALGRM
jgi:uncharacterized coiled-coil protein SlyX